jgi:hypothetical protein
VSLLDHRRLVRHGVRVGIADLEKDLKE